MNDITERFLSVYKYLLDNKLVQNSSEFSKTIGVSSSTMTEILKGRTNAGINPIQNTVRNYPDINPEWLLTGRGSMLREAEEVTHSAEKVIHSERDVFMEERLRSLERENELLRRMVDLLEKSQSTGDSDQMGGERKQVG